MRLMRAYAFGELVKFCDVTAATANAWTKRGVIVAAIEDRGGRGHHRRYSFRNLFEGCIARELTRWGIGIDLIAELLKDCRKHWDGASWKEYLNTRPPGQRAVMTFVPIPPDASGFSFSGALEFFNPRAAPRTRSYLRPGFYSSISIDLTNILESLEQQTKDSWGTEP